MECIIDQRMATFEIASSYKGKFEVELFGSYYLPVAPGSQSLRFIFLFPMSLLI